MAEADIDRIESEVKAGLRNESHRLEEARVNQRHFDGDFDEWVKTWDFDEDCLRTSLIMQRIVSVLTANLYKDGPARTLPEHPQASDWLESVYRANAVDALWQAADALAVVNQVAAFEAQAVTGPESLSRPVRIHLWGADQLAVWLDPDDCTRPVAVATIDRYDETTRLRLWTDKERRTYVTDKFGGATAGARAFRRVAAEPNPYGVLPFAFAHFRFPATYFWGRSPGTNLRRLNHHVNYRLTASADEVVHNRPIGTITGAKSDWNFPRDRKPGTFTTIPSSYVDAAGNGIDARADYITCDLGYIDTDWADLQAFLDHTLEMVGVPPSAVRMAQTDAKSGISIVAEQIPLILWAQSRQKPFGYYEQDLARVVLTVGAKHIAANRAGGAFKGVTAAQLEAAAADPGLSLHWPSMVVELPGDERDQSDKFKLDNKLMSRTQWLMDRAGLSREEAEARLEEVAEDLKREQDLFAALMPVDPKTGAPAAPPTGPDGEDAPATGDTPPTEKAEPLDKQAEAE